MEGILWLGWFVALVLLVKGWNLPRRLEQIRSRNRWLEGEEARLRREMKLKDLERLALMESGTEAVMLVNRPEYRVTNGNMRSRRWLAWNGEEVPLEALPADRMLREILIHATRSAPLERDFILPAGTLPHHETLTAWRLESSIMPGNPFLVILRLRNITRRYRDEQTRKDFVANASHELRTPLTVISGYLEMLMEEDMPLPAEPALRNILAKVDRNTQRLRGLVDDMLTISRFESASARELSSKPFCLKDSLKDILERLDLAIRKAGIAIRFDLPSDEFAIFGDRFYLDQVFYNLISNAIKYNPEGKLEITLAAGLDEDAAGQAEGTWWVEIRDNGVGIPSDSLPYIFNRFYRVETHHSSQIEGTGLGLSIVKRAVEAHGGTVTVRSKPGVETAFRIECPGASRVAPLP